MSLKTKALLIGLLISNAAHANTLLVGNKNDARLTFLNLQSGNIVKTIETGVGPHEIAISPDKQYAVVVNYGDRDNRGNSISLIDVNKGEIINTITDDALLSPHGVQWFKDNRHVLVTAERQDQIVKLDPFTGKIVSTAETRAKVSHMLVISPDEKIAAVSNLGSSDISLIDLVKMKFIKTVKTGNGAEGIDYTPDGKEVWVTNREDDNISVVETEKWTISRTLATGDFPIRVKISGDQKYALVSNANANSLGIYDAKTYALIKTLSLKDGKNNLTMPIGILFSDDNQTAFVAHAGGQKISVINMETLKRTKIIDAGPAPDGMGFVNQSLDFKQ